MEINQHPNMGKISFIAVSTMDLIIQAWGLFFITSSGLNHSLRCIGIFRYLDYSLIVYGHSRLLFNYFAIHISRNCNFFCSRVFWNLLYIVFTNFVFVLFLLLTSETNINFLLPLH